MPGTKEVFAGLLDFTDKVCRDRKLHTKVIIMRRQRSRRNRLSESGNNMLGLANPQLQLEIVSNDDVLQNPVLINRAQPTH